MAERPHGTRAQYQKGCRCPSCTAANTAYEQTYRRTRARGRIPLRSLISAQDAARRIRELQADGLMKKKDIAHALGYKRPILELSTGIGAKMTWRNVLRIKRLHRLRLRLDADSAAS